MVRLGRGFSAFTRNERGGEGVLTEYITQTFAYTFGIGVIFGEVISQAHQD